MYTVAYLLIFISIHASAKEATKIKLIWCDITRNFNPRLREGGDPKYCNQSTYDKFQSTPPRRRRQTFCYYPTKLLIISIHASAKEATIS